MNKRYLLIYVLVLSKGPVTLGQASIQTNYSLETLEKINEVENNITGSVIFNDELPSTITKRMAKYNVKGMSLAVVYNYKIVWAKGYGWADEAEKKPVTTETLF